MTKKPLPPERKAENDKLKALYDAKKKERGLTHHSLADALDISQSGVSHYLNGTNPLNTAVASTFAELLGVEISEFSPRLSEEIRRQAQAVISARPVEANAELIGTMSAWDSSTPLGDDEVAIPLYKEVELAAGCGATEVIEVPGRLLRFAKSTLREAGVMQANAVCATVKGRSMERLIMDGATIGIDTGSTAIEDGEIYAFDQGGMLRVKYLYRLPGGSVRVRSENDEEFPDETLTAEEFAQVRMLGWVFWWSTVRRRRGLSIAK
ncbi:S24 family peptidase [Pseudomonas leptonychotis]|uniref:LexA family transcriptional regulator n=1 Tax=Pseudomonas leptonychotis TaxID=2448482 RepID=UPI0038693561